MAPPSPEGYNPDMMRRSPSIGSHGRGKHVAIYRGCFALILSAVVFFLGHCLDRDARDAGLSCSNLFSISCSFL